VLESLLKYEMKLSAPTE